MQQEQKELNNTTITLMIGTAVFYDALQALLTLIFMGWLVGIFAGLTFYVWFKSYGISFMKPKRFVTFSGSFLIEIIPFLSILPAWTLAITFLALETKIKKVLPKSVQKVVSSTPGLKKTV